MSSIVYASSVIPYALINGEVANVAQVKDYMTEVSKMYGVYRKGAEFTVEGNNGDYVSANLKYKQVASLINKQARFMFANTPDFNVLTRTSADTLTDVEKAEVDKLQCMVKNVLQDNMVESGLLMGAKDCFIGGRIAIVVNYTQEEGIDITFLNAMQFICEESAKGKLSKFIALVTTVHSNVLTEKRILKKKYVMVNGKCVITESIHDGIGKVIEEEVEIHTELPFIPAAVIDNDSLLGDEVGQSEVEQLKDYESYYSKLSNSDIDSGRKNMNPVRYTIDIAPHTTANLSTSAGSYWDLASDQNMAEGAKPQVGMLKGGMDYSDALSTTLDRIKQQAYDEAAVPNINIETMSGAIATGKGLKAIYWELTVRCEEKMKVWKPKLEQIVKYIIEGAKLYPEAAAHHIEEKLGKDVKYVVEVINKYPIPEDEAEEKGLDMQEVNAQVMSKKTYMVKWRGLTDKEAQEELQQIAYERELLEDTYGNAGAGMQEEDEEVIDLGN